MYNITQYACIMMYSNGLSETLTLFYAYVHSIRKLTQIVTRFIKTLYEYVYTYMRCVTSHNLQRRYMYVHTHYTALCIPPDRFERDATTADDIILQSFIIIRFL